MPTLARLQERGQCRLTDVGSLPMSRPVYAVLSTGLEADRAGNRDNDDTGPLAAQSIWELARAAGLRVAAVSELPWWQELFPRGFDDYVLAAQSANYFELVPAADRWWCRRWQRRWVSLAELPSWPVVRPTQPARNCSAGRGRDLDPGQNQGNPRRTLGAQSDPSDRRGKPRVQARSTHRVPGRGLPVARASAGHIVGHRGGAARGLQQCRFRLRRSHGESPTRPTDGYPPRGHSDPARSAERPLHGHGTGGPGGTGGSGYAWRCVEWCGRPPATDRGGCRTR